MRYITITTWEIDDGANIDLVLERVRKHRLPAMKELGAEKVQVLQTSERTLAAVTEWRDRVTRDEAEEWVQKVRKDLHAEDQSRMTGEFRGAVVAEI